MTVYSKHITYENCIVKAETDKAILFEVSSSAGSFLPDRNIAFWIPRSVITIKSNCIEIPDWFKIRKFTTHG